MSLLWLLNSPSPDRSFKYKTTASNYVVAHKIRRVRIIAAARESSEKSSKRETMNLQSS